MRAATLYLRLVAAGFRRWSTYRVAALAGLTTNVLFGFMRCAVLLTIFAEAADVAGYDASAAVTFVWVGQALIDLVLSWGRVELQLRIRSGDIAIDLVRPWDLQLAQLADDIGRAGFSLLTRFVPPMVVGALCFDLRLPSTVAGWAVSALSIALAVVAGFGLRFLLALTAFWLLDWRGVQTVYGVTSGLLSGLVVPIALFGDWARIAIWCTPFPALVQAPADVLVGRGDTALLLAHQAAWAIGSLVVGRLVLRRATAKLVVQGG